MNQEIPSVYMKQIQRYPLLTAEDEIELSKQVQSGSKAAVTKLVNSNLRLVVSVAHKFSAYRIPIMDLVQEGCMGLMVAAEKYNCTFNTRFSTYAYPWIAQYMIRYANSHENCICLPHRKDDLIRKIRAAQNTMFSQNGHEPTLREVALFIGVPESKVIDAMQFAYTYASLDMETGDSENSSTLADLIPDTDYTPEQLLLREEEKAGVRKMLFSLTRNEQRVLWYRYNFDGDMRGKTLREISAIIGVSPEAVRQTEIRAMHHLKKVSGLC